MLRLCKVEPWLASNRQENVTNRRKPLRLAMAKPSTAAAPANRNFNFNVMSTKLFNNNSSTLHKNFIQNLDNNVLHV